MTGPGFFPSQGRGRPDVLQGLPINEGINRYDPSRGKWVRVSRLSPSELVEGCNLIYFRNLLCTPCRIFDLKLPDLVASYACRCAIFMVTCGFYARLCLSRQARDAFTAFGVREAPTVYVAIASGGRVVREAYIVGNLSLSEFRSYVLRSFGIGRCGGRRRGS